MSMFQKKLREISQTHMLQIKYLIDKFIILKSMSNLTPCFSFYFFNAYFYLDSVKKEKETSKLKHKQFMPDMK